RGQARGAPRGDRRAPRRRAHGDRGLAREPRGDPRPGDGGQQGQARAPPRRGHDLDPGGALRRDAPGEGRTVAMSISVYVAARWETKDDAAKLRDGLAEFGIRCTSRWIDEGAS